MSWHPARLAGRSAFVTAAVVSVAAIAAACAAPAAQHPAASPVAGHDVLSAARQSTAAGAPKYFIDNVLFSGSVSGGLPQVRLASSGGLVTQPGIRAFAIAALGSRGTFVIAEYAATGCATRLYRAALATNGKLGKLHLLGTVPDEVVSLTADTDGNAVAFTAGCFDKSASSSGYLGVLDLRTGAVRRWGSVNLGSSAGSIAVSALSISADGGLVAFLGSKVAPSGRPAGQGVWVLKTSAAAGQLVKRSHRILSAPAAGATLASVILNSSGSSFYLCSMRFGRASSSAVAEYRTSDGRLTKTIATLAAGDDPLTGQLGCPMAADPSGADLLVPYALVAASSPEAGSLVRVARIHVASGSVARFSFRLPGSAGMSVAYGVAMAW